MILMHGGPQSKSWGFEVLDSNVRFMRVLTCHKYSSPKVRYSADCERCCWTSRRPGRRKDSVSLTIDEKSTNAFGAFLVEQIPELYAAFRRRVDA